MEKQLSDMFDFAVYTYTKQNICDNTLDDAQLETRCPLDNGRRRHVDASTPISISISIPTRCSIGQLDQLPLVESVPQYAALIQHCPNIIRAIVSIHADAFDCDTLYRTLRTHRCSTCTRFGDHLYLIDCRRVCYFCFTRRLEYLPLTVRQASSFFVLGADETQQRNAISTRRRLHAAKLPSVLSLPGRYCTAWGSQGGNSARKRLQLFDHRAVVQSLATSSLTKLDETTRKPRRFMAIITALYLLDAGRQADWGYFCLGCKEEKQEDTRHFRIKYTKGDILEHFARHGKVKVMPRIPGRFMHVTEDLVVKPSS
ncbi:uncharacterized protein RAG0_16659 [Rhynchosporium agropyri]|uniref:F-box domain-containing protein n=1 Tax=Rhynchosporium agropyri TaxID=914238 RepID=A0A1E1LRH5_9HELO|nr:uncharacterized protein RAG0_16659 [Rhynchosporium agropyri]